MRYKVAVESTQLESQVYKDRIVADEVAHQMRIKESDVKYQHNQNQALKNELERATSYYESVLQEVRTKVDTEKEGLQDLENDLRNLEQERDSLRFEIGGLRKEIDQKKEFRSGSTNSDLDMAI